MTAAREPLGVYGCILDPAHTGFCKDGKGWSGRSGKQPPHPTCPDCLDRDRLIWRVTQRAEKAEAQVRLQRETADRLRAIADLIDPDLPDTQLALDMETP